MFKYKILEDILTTGECQQIIETYEPLLDLQNLEEFPNYEHYKYFTYSFRNSKLSEILFERIKDLIPENICEISNQWYISKYLPNQGYISEHFDGNVLYKEKISQYSFLLYLNDDFEDGETVISDPYFKEKIKIKPETGSILLLDQDILYYSEKPQDNSKYILRSDLMVKC